MILNKKDIVKKDNYNIFILITIIFIYIISTCIYRDLFGMECRNALFAKEMLNNIKFIPTYLNHPYPDYPPIYFWLEVFFAKLIGGINTISAVLPSCLAFLGTSIVLFFLIKSISKDINLALLTTIIFLSFPKIFDAASHVTIDILLTFTVSVTLICLYLSDKNKDIGHIYNYKWFSISIIFMIISFLVKGLIGIVLPFVVWNLYLFLKYRRSSIRFILYFSLICFLVAIICQFIEFFIDYKEYGLSFAKRVISLQVTSRLTKYKDQIPFYYILVTISCIFPWLIVVIYLFFINTKNINFFKKFRYIYNKFHLSVIEYDLLLFGISWFIGIFTVFELASCKHSRYLYPATPGLAIILAIIIYELYNHDNKLLSFFKKFSLTILFLPFIPILLGIKEVTLHITIFSLIILITFICWYLISFINTKIRPWFYLSMTIIFLISSFSLLFNTKYSQKQSGSQFMNCINTHAKHIFSTYKNIPVYVCGIKMDGNGVKLSYYAASYLNLKFINYKELSKLKKPSLLICYQKDAQKLLNILDKKYKTQILCKGLVHKVPTEGFLITKKTKQGKNNEQISTFNTIGSTFKCICSDCSKTGDENNR